MSHTSDDIVERILAVAFLDCPKEVNALRDDFFKVVDEHRPGREVLITALSGVIVGSMCDQFDMARDGIDSEEVTVALLRKGFELRRGARSN